MNCSELKSKCPICGDTGVTKGSNGNWVECKCHAEKTREEVRQNRLKSACNFAKMPKEFADIRLDDYKINTAKVDDDSKKTVQAKRIAVAYIEKFKEMQTTGTGLYLHSNSKGSGKTMLAAIIGNELIEQGIAVRYATMADILSKIKNTFNDKTETESKLISELQEVELLILDDLGIEKVTEWGNEKVYSIINQRMITNKPVIVTSNTELEKLSYDERVRNRLLKMCLRVEMPEKSVRIAMAKKQNDNILNALLGEDA